MTETDTVVSSQDNIEMDTELKQQLSISVLLLTKTVHFMKFPKMQTDFVYTGSPNIICGGCDM